MLGIFRHQFLRVKGDNICQDIQNGVPLKEKKAQMTPRELKYSQKLQEKFLLP